MNTSLTQRLLTGRILTRADTQALQAEARSLMLAVREGVQQPLLKGKHIALLCEGLPSQEALGFAQAARMLGARVSELDIGELLSAGHAEASLRLLPKLYDMVWCDGLPAQQVRGLQTHIGIPVCSNPVTPSNAEPEENDRLYLAQALLMRVLAEA